MNKIDETEINNALFIICPFCQLENFLRTEFGEKIFFLTLPGAVIEHKSEEDLYLSDFLKSEKISDIYVVNDVSCNFIEDADNPKEEFGLKCEKQFKELKKRLSNESTNLSLKEKNKLVAKMNVKEQLDYLKKLKIFSEESNKVNINLRAMVTDKNKEFEIVD